MAETQEIYCHHCSNYIRFKTNPEKTGNLIIVCPHDNCGHQHCRKVVNGVVTDDRWDCQIGEIDPRWSSAHKDSLWEEKNKK